jgi:O-antigen ligase
VMATGLYLKRDMIEKTRINLSAQGSITAMRGETARSAVETWRQSPLWGVGPGNLPEVTREQIEAWVTSRGMPFEASRYTWRLHAHNLYFNTLAERGLLGLSALLALAALWAHQLIRHRPSPAADAMRWTAWGAGLSGFTLVFVGGLFNTTLHHEHGMLAMLCLAMLLNLSREPDQ